MSIIREFGQVVREKNDIIAALTRERDSAKAEVERLRGAIENLRDHWTHKHVVNTPLDRAVVDTFLALTPAPPQAKAPDAGGGV